MNKHIEKYLDLYLERENVEYATLLTGKWGCGKTYFIKNYIEKKSKEKKYKFIYISLFGLKDIQSVNDAIFEELHPVLSHKGVKILGGVLKSAIKLGFKFDLVGDKNEETSVNIDFTKLNPFEKTEYKNLIFIFDDLERTLISTTEILGFINSICENENVKTIIISNEDEIDNNNETYKRFKEKVIGKSLTILNDNEEYWESFKKNYHSKLKKYEVIINVIKSAFEEFGNRNYRNLIQTTEDYIDFIKEIDSSYLDNDEFIVNLSLQFYILSLEYKKQHNIDSVLKSLKESKPEYYYRLLFDKIIWEMIITSQYNSYNKLNELISSFPEFNIKEEESWRKLWHYKESSKDDFYSNLEDVKTKFISLEYKDIAIIIHVIGMLIFFIKNKLCNDISIEKIKETINDYIKEYKDISQIQNLDYNFHFNNTGLGYINEDDEDFIEAIKHLDEKLKEKKLTLEKEKNTEDFYNSLPFIKAGDWKTVYSKHNKYYEYDPFLDKEDVCKVIEQLNDEVNNYKGLYNFCAFLYERYKKGMEINQRIKLEETFLNELICYIENNYIREAIDPFERFNLFEILEQLNKTKEIFKTS
ncbi:P-loop NTPase fold protein [uncultured Haemophilus sp.]|uniref:P-loop NTPase fold protein n=1 Tax=uncultured Haemophilus sp. TaxID=237779 RepID=UPI0025D169FC|nr:P-loop NTPase fold protein [uncultured Haemophilus sp.]